MDNTIQMIVWLRSGLLSPQTLKCNSIQSMLKILGTEHLALSLLVLSWDSDEKRQSQGAGALKDRHRLPQPRRAIKPNKLEHTRICRQSCRWSSMTCVLWCWFSQVDNQLYWGKAVSPWLSRIAVMLMYEKKTPESLFCQKLSFQLPLLVSPCYSLHAVYMLPPKNTYRFKILLAEEEETGLRSSILGACSVSHQEMMRRHCSSSCPGLLQSSQELQHITACKTHHGR